MSELYKRIEMLCLRRGITITDMCRESGASRGSLTDLKSGRINTLKAETMKKVADHFGVSVDYLMTGEETKAAPAQLSESGEMAEILTEFKDNPELRTLFSITSKARPEDLKKYIDVIKAIRGSNDGDEDY